MDIMQISTNQGEIHTRKADRLSICVVIKRIRSLIQLNNQGGSSGDMHRIFLIRHGESQANAGLATIDPENVALTPRGYAQAECIANFLRSYTSLNLIVTSAYLRTKQTAAPTKKVFRTIPEEEWEVHEFTYLWSMHGEQSTAEERKPLVDAYWEQCQPSFVDNLGTGSFKSESFKVFIGRIQAFLRRLKDAAYDRRENIAIFSHEQFITAVLWFIDRRPVEISSEEMRDFRDFFNLNRIPNGAIVEVKVRRSHDAWPYQHLKYAASEPELPVVEADSLPTGLAH